MPSLRTIVLTLVCLMQAFALDPRFRISQYHKRHWQVEDGLPRNYVMSTLPDTEGYLLVATDEGLMRFDGVRFTPYAIEQALRLPERWVLTMLRAREGSLWMGTFDGSLYQLKKGHLVSKHEPGDSVFSIIDDGAGRIWASTRGGVLCSKGAGFDIAGFEHVAGLNRPLDTSWNVLARDADGSVWIVTVDGLFHAANDGAVHRVAASGGAWGDIVSVHTDARGHVWVGASRGLYEVVAQTQLRQVVDTPAPVVTLLADRDGTLWIGTWGKSVFRLRDGKLDSWAASDASADEFIRTMYEDRERNLWIGTRTGGLWRWSDRPARPYGVLEGLAGNFASTVTGARDGTLWFGTWRGGLYRYRDSRFALQQTGVPTPYLTIRALALDRNDRPWFGNWEGLTGFDGRVYRHYFDANSPCYHVSAILFDRAGRLWVGTANNGLYLFADGRPAERAAQTFLPHTEITSLVEDADGRVWASTQEGAVWFDNAPRPTEHGAGLRERTRVSSLSLDGHGRVWAAMKNGELVRLAANAAPVALSAKHGLPGWPLYRLVDDEAGSYWVSSAHGILQIPADAAERVMTGRAARLDVNTFNQEDGLRTIECHGMSQPAGWRDSSGGVWFPTTKGFVHVEPYAREQLTVTAPRIEEIAVDGVHTWGPRLMLEPGIRNFSVRYTAFHFSAADKIQFRYRLEGFDPDWVDAGVVRDARYSRLPPGTYRFLIASRMPGGAWSERPTALTIIQKPRFYQTRWFWSLMALLAAAGVYGLVRWRVHLVKSRYAAVLGERNRIAREWHDTLLAGFAAISWQLDETLSRLKESPSRALETIEMALKMVGYYRAEARRVIWDMRDNRPESETLADALTSSLRQFGGNSADLAPVRVIGEAVHLGEETERNLLRICQEAVSNARRHGKATSIEVELDYQPRSVRLSVRDNGCGFEPALNTSAASGHFGLTVMAERAQRIGGRLKIESKPGAGTTVEANVPTHAH